MRTRKETTKTCERCGRQFKIHTVLHEMGRGRFCSWKCRQGTPEDRFWPNVDKQGPDDCWLWTGYLCSKGYGAMSVDGGYMSAHRFSYTLHYGVAPPTHMHVMHSCDTPTCVNPAHLSVGTCKDNVQDMMNKGRGHAGRKKSK